MCLVDVELRDEASPMVVSEPGSLKNLQAEHVCHLDETWEATHYQAERAWGAIGDAIYQSLYRTTADTSL